MTTPADFKPELYDWNMLTNAPKENNWIKDAWHILTMAMITDPSWAWSVHCNLAMPIMDTLNCSHIEANNAAAILMKHIFNYDVTQLEVFKDIIQRSVSESNGDRTKSLSDKFDPDYAKFGIRNKYDLVRGKLIPVNPEIPFHQKVKEYFIEHAYYSNKNYPSILFMIGESLNNDSVLFKTIKAGNLGDMERTLIIPNDELNFDDFKLVLNPANEAIEETSATCDASDFLSDLTNRIKEHRSIGSEPCDKDCIVKGTKVNPIAAHREKLLNFFKHGMTYLKKHRDDVYYTYRDDMSSHKRLVFECKSTDCADAAFRTVDIERIDLNDWQAVEGNSNVNRKCYPHEEFRAAINNEQSFKEADYHIDEVVKFCSKLNASLITAQQSSKEPDNTSKGTDDMTHQEKVLSFFKPEGMYIKPSAGGVLYILCEELSNQDQLTFYCNVNNDHGPYRRIRINDIDLNDWQLLGELVVADNSLTGEKIKIVTKKPFRGQSTELISPIQSTEESDKLQSIIEMTRDPITSRIEQLNPETKESLLNILKVRNFFKPNGVYRNKCCANDSRHIYKSHQPHFDKLAFNRVSKHDNGEVLFDIYNVELNDWVFLGIDEPIDPKVQLCQKVKAFFKPGRVYSHRICRSNLRFEGQEVLSTGTILRFIEASMGRLVTHRIDKIDLDDWTDITDTSAASHRRYSFPHYEINVKDESSRTVPTTNELGPQLLFLCSRRGPINSPFHGSRGECIDKLSQADNKNQTYEYEYNNKFLIPWHIYCKTSNRDVLRFERKIPSLQSKVILRFRRVPNNEIVEFSIDEFRRDDWQDITYKLYQ